MTRERQIFLISFLALFLELAWIRFLGSEIRIFAYMSNLLLLVCFLGLGYGCARAHLPARLGWAYVASAALVLALVPDALAGRLALRRITEYLGGDPVFHVWAVGGARVGWLALGRFGIGLFLLLLIVGALLLVMVPIGQNLGRLLRESPDAIRAYSSDIGGSLMGVVCFTLLSFLSAPPPVWFAIGLGGLLYFLPRSRTRLAGAVVAIALVVGFADRTRDGETEVVWSPYQRLSVIPTYKPSALEPEVETGFIVQTNHADYMRVGNYAPEFVERYPEFFADPELRPYDNYSLPYRFHPNPRDVLIVGAGAGNDVAGALRNGVEHVDAVEIDPEIVRLGRERHPERPYTADHGDRVTVHVDDARSFFRTTDRRYDLIIFGTLDSHTLSSSMCNVRLDNFVYTAESFRDAKRLLKPDGVVALLFAVNDPYIGVRIRRAIEEVFEAPPLCLKQSSKIVYWVYYFIAGSQETIQSRLAHDAVLRGVYEQNRVEWPGETPLASDDWPYLFLRRPAIPSVYIAVFASLLALAWFLLQRGVGGAAGILDRSGREFGLLGAGFMLLEVHGITRAALSFGGTWINNAIVIGGILLAILLANEWVRRWRPQRLSGCYGLLIAALAANYLFPSALLNELPLALRVMAVIVLICSPVVAAGIVFATQFSRVKDRNRAFASNLVGAMVGGMSESLSFLVGLRALSLVAMVLYGLAYLQYRQSRGQS